jgi:hypothetical protein
MCVCNISRIITCDYFCTGCLKRNWSKFSEDIVLFSAVYGVFTIVQLCQYYVRYFPLFAAYLIVCTCRGWYYCLFRRSFVVILRWGYLTSVLRLIVYVPWLGRVVATASHRRGRGLRPVESTWYLWSTKWHWDRAYPEFFISLCPYHSTVAIHAHISPGGWTIGLLVSAVLRHSLTPWTWTRIRRLAKTNVARGLVAHYQKSPVRFHTSH